MHCLNAFAYFKDEMPDIKERIDWIEKSEVFYEVIDEDGNKYGLGERDPLLQKLKIKEKTEINKLQAKTININDIKKKYPELRQKGKPFTFGFSYGASPKKYGEDLYNAYWETYSATKEYNERIIKRAKLKGYIISRYSGIRLKVPDLFAENEYDKSKAERVVSNFNIQSGNIFTLYAMVKFQERIEEADMLDKIKLVNTVHDAIYLYIKEDKEAIDWVNKNLIDCMVSDYNSGRYDDVLVPLTAELDLGYNMAKVITLPNECDFSCIDKNLNELKELYEQN